MCSEVLWEARQKAKLKEIGSEEYQKEIMRDMSRLKFKMALMTKHKEAKK